MISPTMAARLVTQAFGITPTDSNRLNTVAVGVQPRFGRDAIFERNDRFEGFTSQDQARCTALQDFVKRKNIQQMPASEKQALAKEIDQQSAFLYTDEGRVRGKHCVDYALPAAMAEYVLQSEADPQAPVEKALAGIKLANAMLAADVRNGQAFQLLDESLKLLAENIPFEDLARELTQKQQGLVAHGYYNRGAYVANNPIFKFSMRGVSPDHVLASEVSHEGLTMTLSSHGRLKPAVEHVLKVVDRVPDLDIHAVLKSGSDKLYGLLTEFVDSGIPDLERALRLAQQSPATQTLAEPEYLTALGEAHHLGYHMTERDEDRDSYNSLSYGAFKQALLQLFKAADTATGHHFKLAERLAFVKLRHLAEPRHLTDQREEVIELQGQTQSFLQKLNARGVETPPETTGERLAREQKYGYFLDPEPIRSDLSDSLSRMFRMMGDP
ncbi:MAG: hypothetical protein SFZ03_11990 [Candidatus Melainabacteria bacterium]|nr:hypothetical protein [Candidatus Melainabacteria bacterium]